MEFPFRFVADWYEYQKKFINGLDTRTMIDTPAAADTTALSEVIVYKDKRPLPIRFPYRSTATGW